MARKKSQNSFVRRLHRSLGAGTAVFIIFMVLSGLTINHSNGLGLDQRHVSQPFVLNWYGLEEPENIRSFALGNDWLSFAGSQLYLNGDSISGISNGVGAISSHNMLMAAGNEELLLLDPNGTLIERLPWGPPGAGPIESIGQLADGSVVVQSVGQLWLADADLLSWQRAEGTNVNPTWAFSEPAPGALREAITRHYRGDGLSLERVLLDLHSGRIFGSIGVLVYDLLALAVAFLAISGLIFWLRGRRNGKQNGQRQNPGS